MAYQNFFATKLYTEVGASDSTITLETVPTATSGRLVLEARNPTQREIIRYTGISGNTITGVSRGQGGTTAKAHVKNSLVEMNVTSEDLEDALGVPNDMATRFDELFADSIVPNTGVVAIVSGLTISISNMTYYINGVRYTKASIPNKVLTATKDTYGFIDTAGNITWTEVTVGAAAPTTPANSVAFVVITTSATTSTKILLINRAAVASENLNIRSYVDSEGWTVIDFGNYKRYMYKHVHSTGAQMAAGSTSSTTVTPPIGVPANSLRSSSARYVLQATPTGTKDAEVFNSSFGVRVPFGTSDTAISLTLKNAHSAAQAMGTIVWQLTIEEWK